jgi:hypothetical protein
LDRPDSVRAALIRRESLSIELVVGDEPAALAPILSIFDGEAREMLLIGALGEDLLLRAWTLARELRLDHPDIRWAGAFAGVAVGDTITLQIAPDRGSWCARVGSDQGCHMAPGPGDGYGFLLAVEGGPQWLRWLAATVWGFLLGAAIGLSVPGPRLAIGIACAVAAAGLGLGLVTPDLRPDLWHCLTLVAGSLVGTSTSSEAIELIRFARGSQRAPRLRLSPMPVEPQRQSP